jgi:molecular chaperone DnaK (HSP70)
VNWTILPEDDFCGFCGRAVCSLDIDISPPIGYRDKPAPVTLRLNNTGSIPLQIRELSPPPSWAIDKTATPFDLGPTALREITLKPITPLTAQTYGIKVIAHKLSDREPNFGDLTNSSETVGSNVSEQIGKQTEWQIYDSTPQLSLRCEEEFLFVEGRRDEQAAEWKEGQNNSAFVNNGVLEINPISCGLFLSTRNFPAHIRSLKSQCAWWQPKMRSIDNLRLEPEQEQKIDGQILPHLLPKNSGKIQGEISCELVGVPEPLSIFFGVTLNRKLQMHLENLTQEAYQFHNHLDTSKPLSLHITSEMVGLEITDIKFSASDGLRAAELLTKLPIRFSPETQSPKSADSLPKPNAPITQVVEFVLLRDQRTKGEYDLKIELRSQTWRDSFPFRVNMVQAPSELVAIDFGTSNSCCAYLPDKKSANDSEPEYHLLQINPNSLNNKDILPTWIFYETLNQYHIGEDAQTHRVRYLQQRENNNFVRSIKRRLGRKQPLVFYFKGEHQRSMIPGEITRDYIAGILKQIKDKGHNISELVITHPTRFTERQLKELRDRLRELGFGQPEKTHQQNLKPLLMLDEASATAYYYVEKQKKLHPQNKNGDAEQNTTTAQEDYNLVVYDFGGGTTDITISHITIQQTQNPPLTIKTVAAGGLRTLGGEDITHQIWKSFIEPVIKAEIQKDMAASLQRREHIEILYTPPEDNNFFQSSPAINKQNIKLYEEAEKLKLSLSRTGQAEWRESLNIIYRIGNAEETKKIELGLQIDKDSFEKMLEELLQPAIEYLEGMLIGNNLSLSEQDVILLVGQSSQLPLLKTLLQQKFKCRTESLNADEIKSCVALGSCMYAKFKRYDVQDKKQDKEQDKEQDKQVRFVNFGQVTRFAYSLMISDFWRGFILEEIVPQLNPLPQEKSLPNFEIGNRLEIWQNATPWIIETQAKGIDADRIGYISVDGSVANLIADRPHKWYLRINQDESVEIVLKILSEAQEPIEEYSYPCDLSD